MATITVNTCDRCGIDDHGQEVQFWSVGYGLTHGFSSHITANSANRTWCRRCCIETGILVVKEESRAKELKTETPPAPLTFEEMLREIIREEIDFSKE
jgi:hypothetical protein